ncbi:MAG: YceI family protein [Schleiferiaceae bacterium]|jgi:polyisoprenoid-binding protein YceI|nr:YceI family protein [Schleiferiaceae bacterium]
MKIRSIALGIFAGLAFTAFGQNNIDANQSKVSFEVSNMKVNTVEGQFTGMKGNVNVVNNQIVSIDVCIDAASVNTDNTKRDEHLRNEDFFEVEKYKEICFISQKITKTEDGFIANGTLEMHGVTKSVSIPLSLNNGVVTGKFSIDRYDFGVGSDGSFSVGREVELTINCVLTNKES